MIEAIIALINHTRTQLNEIHAFPALPNSTDNIQVYTAMLRLAMREEFYWHLEPTLLSTIMHREFSAVESGIVEISQCLYVKEQYKQARKARYALRNRAFNLSTVPEIQRATYWLGWSLPMCIMLR